MRMQWDTTFCACGDAQHLPATLRHLADPHRPQSIGEHAIEDHIAPNALLFEAAVPTAFIAPALAVGDGQPANDDQLRRALMR